MPNTTNFMAIVLVYFLLVYLLPVRRGRQPLLLWLFLILVQAASVFYFRTLCSYAYHIPFLAEFTDDIRQYIVVGILIVMNLILIFLLNLAFHKKVDNDATDSSEVEMDIDNLQLNFTQEPVQHQDDSSNVLFTPETLSSPNVDEVEFFDSIQTMINSGQTDEATKYLRMVAFFGTNKSLMDRAEKMLHSIEKTS